MIAKKAQISNTICDTRIDQAFNIVVVVFCTLLVILLLYPLYFVVCASISNPSMMAKGKTLLYPVRLTTLGYEEIFKNRDIWIGYKNTIIYTVGGTFFSLLFTLPAGYALSRQDFAPRSVIMLLFTFTMFFSGGMIPTYLTVKLFGLTNTVWVMILPFCVSAYNLIICRTFFQSSIPKELLEASQLDGCTDLRFFASIVLPVSKALISVIALYYAVGYWNQYFNALLYLTDERMKPLQLVLREILMQSQVFADGQSTSGADATIAQKADLIKFGVIIVSSLPVIIVFPFLQKYFEKGVMIGSVKG